MNATNRKAFLDTIAYSEIGPPLLAVSDNGYNVLVGSTAQHPLLFDSYAEHPHILNHELNSTAAGRYQILGHYFEDYKKLLHLPDFSPDSQDAVALQMIKEQHALSDVDAGHVEAAIHKCSNIWASFPGAGYGQHENKMENLKTAYTNAGGTYA